MAEYYNMIAVHDNNYELHNQLERIGYKKLPWTTFTGIHNQTTILTNSYHYNQYGKYVFWTTGSDIEKIKAASNVIYCDTLNEFLKLANELLNNEYISI